MATAIERVPVPDRIEPAAIPEESARQIERANYEKGRELIAEGRRDRVERALGFARDEAARIAQTRAHWAALPWADPTMPADLLAELRADLGRLPYQIKGVERALAQA